MSKETDLARYFRSIGIRPTFTNNKIFGNLYVVDNLYPKAKFPEKFIGVSDKTNKFYLFDMHIFYYYGKCILNRCSPNYLNY